MQPPRQEKLRQLQAAAGLASAKNRAVRIVSAAAISRKELERIRGEERKAEAFRILSEEVQKSLDADVAVSVTGLAGPGGDDHGNPVGTVFVGYADKNLCLTKRFLFSGDREQIRKQAIEAALLLVLEYNA